VVIDEVQNSSPKISSRHGTFHMGEEVEVFYTTVKNPSFNNFDNDLSDWIQEADSGGWFDKEEELQIDAEWLRESQKTELEERARPQQDITDRQYHKKEATRSVSKELLPRVKKNTYE
ncbi:23313_t:CDS:2, partial [Gigaspora margarita]